MLCGGGRGERETALANAGARLCRWTTMRSTAMHACMKPCSLRQADCVRRPERERRRKKGMRFLSSGCRSSVATTRRAHRHYMRASASMTERSCLFSQSNLIASLQNERTTNERRGSTADSAWPRAQRRHRRGIVALVLPRGGPSAGLPEAGKARVSHCLVHTQMHLENTHLS